MTDFTILGAANLIGKPNMPADGIKFDPQETLRTLEVLHEPGNHYEIRIPKARRGGVVSGYFDFSSRYLAVQKVEVWNGNAPAVYITLNPVDPVLMARSWNDLSKFASNLTTNEEIIRRRWILIDFDPKRPSGISSTDEQHEAALKRAGDCREHLREKGITAILADSGNGGHVLIRIDEPNDIDSRELVKRTLTWASSRYGDNVVEVDKGVFKAAQLTKLYGTWVAKGVDIPERPHRISRILEVPDRMEVVSREILLATLSKPIGGRGPYDEFEERDTDEFEKTWRPVRHASFDLERWIEGHNLAVSKKKSDPDGSVLFELADCPWNPEHSNKAFVKQFADGHIIAKCLHTNCLGKSWQDLRDVVEPGWRKLVGPSLNSDRLAERFLDTEFTHEDVRTLRYYRGDYYEFRSHVYRELPFDDVVTALYRSVKAEYDRVAAKSGNAVKDVTTTKMSHIRMALKSKAIIASSQDVPCWLGGAEPWPAKDLLPALNGLFHIPSLAAGVEALMPPTPRFFSTFALDYAIDARAPEPSRWLNFLDQIWPDDRECIDTLQEFFGYFLTQDTSQQKILMLIGPRRSGKGTIGRVLTGLIGPSNVAGPAFESLKEQFGLESLLGKTLAIVPDARLKSQSGYIVERLLSISGEDMVTVERKHKTAVHVRLPTRIVLLTNELPALDDASGAMAGRLILLPMTESFFGKENRNLTNELLEERAGILMWAIEGWKRLNERGRFIQPESGKDELEDIEEQGSKVAEFVSERCEIRPIFEIPRHKLYAAYKRWCEDAGITHPVAPNTFGRDLRAVVRKLGVRLSSSQPSGDPNRPRNYVGITLKDKYL